MLKRLAVDIGGFLLLGLAAWFFFAVISQW
jgi:hypothetical protein